MAMFNNIYRNIISRVQRILTVNETINLHTIPVEILPSVKNKTYCILGGQMKLYSGSTPYNQNRKIHVVDFNVDTNLNIGRFNIPLSSGENSGGLEIVNPNLSNNIQSEIYLKLDNNTSGGDIEYQITLFYSLV